MNENAAVSQKGSGRANIHERTVWNMERSVLSSRTRRKAWTKSSKSIDGAVTSTQSVDAWPE